MPQYGTNLALVGGSVTPDSLQSTDHDPHGPDGGYRPGGHGGEDERLPLEYCARVWEDFLRTLNRIETDFVHRCGTTEPGVQA